MTKSVLKKVAVYLTLGMFWGLGILSCAAQTFSTGLAPTPGVLVSQGLNSNNNGQNLEKTLVDIKAVDPPALRTKEGRLGMASEERYGQGIIIDADGIIATNRHIIGNAQHIYVVLSGGKILEAKLIRNSKADLCLIKINDPTPLKAVSLADASDVRVGSNVIAIANAGFNPQRVLGGQIVQIFKEVSSDNIEMLETNISLKPGDSGGPILNENGSLLGLIMGKQISDPSKSYAIASNRIQLEYFKYRNSILN